MVTRPDATAHVPSRTIDTVAQYRRRAKMLFAQAGARAIASDADRLDTVIHWFAAQRRRWKSSTLRLYRAALRTAVDDAVVANVIGSDHAHKLHSMIDAGPEPLRSTRIKRTSARKRCRVGHAELFRIIRFLEARGRETDQLLALVIGCLSIVGLRPCELWSARLAGRRLIVKCAKNTNNRSIGETREVNIDDKAVRGKIKLLLKQLQRLRITNRDEAKRLHGRLAKALERACKACGIKKISLYTLRHQALASAKLTMEPAAASALAGHASQITIIRSYAPRRAGWRLKQLISIDPQLAAKVRTTISFHPARADSAAPVPGW